jgi:hypothetical protein
MTVKIQPKPKSKIKKKAFPQTKIKVKRSLEPLKTEVVTLRLNPKTRFGLELLSRKQYRTLSSVIEWSINEATAREHDGIPELDNIWDVEEADRLVKLALTYPNLLTYEEQKIWKIITENATYWLGRFVPNNKGDEEEWIWPIEKEGVVFDRIRDDFNQIKEVANGFAEKSTLPDWDKVRKLEIKK